MSLNNEELSVPIIRCVMRPIKMIYANNKSEKTLKVVVKCQNNSTYIIHIHAIINLTYFSFVNLKYIAPHNMWRKFKGDNDNPKRCFMTYRNN